MRRVGVVVRQRSPDPGLHILFPSQVFLNFEAAASIVEHFEESKKNCETHLTDINLMSSPYGHLRTVGGKLHSATEMCR